MSNDDDPYVREWQKAVDADRPRQRRKLIGTIAASLVACAVVGLGFFVTANVAAHDRRGKLTVAAFGGSFLAAMFAYAVVYGLITNERD